jgi:hypothetical protein
MITFPPHRKFTALMIPLPDHEPFESAALALPMAVLAFYEILG